MSSDMSHHKPIGRVIQISIFFALRLSGSASNSSEMLYHGAFKALEPEPKESV